MEQLRLRDYYVAAFKSKLYRWLVISLSIAILIEIIFIQHPIIYWSTLEVLRLR